MAQPPEIDIETFATVHTRGQVVDVREPVEFVSGHVPGARLVPLAQLPAHLEHLHKDEPVYVICASGHRSLVGAEFLNHHGFDATSVAGGTKGWVSSGRPVERGLD